MKAFSRILLCIAVTILCHDAHADEELNHGIVSDSSQREKLAIIVQGHEDSMLDVDRVQTLIEVECFEQWQGELLERKEIDSLLGEMEMSTAITGPSATVSLGKLLHVDYFVLVTVEKDKVSCVVNTFPEATVVTESVYQNQLTEESLAKQIVIYSLKAINEYELDKSKAYISIGSFLYEDPFRQYLNISDDIHNALRKKLSQQPAIVLTERLFPSHLLDEYNLARAGLSKRINAHLCAPPADVLIYGQFKPKDAQNLASPDTVLDFEITFISPTGLIDKTVKSFSRSSDDIKYVVEQIEHSLSVIMNSIEDRLQKRTERQFNDAEYDTFKQQAMALMPSPYSSIMDSLTEPDEAEQIIYEYERSLRAIEIAFLFKSNDAELMLTAGLMLGRMVDNKARTLYYKKDDPIYRDEYERIKAISTVSLNYIENAYYLECNEQTRDGYVRRCYGLL